MKTCAYCGNKLSDTAVTCNQCLHSVDPKRNVKRPNRSLHSVDRKGHIKQQPVDSKRPVMSYAVNVSGTNPVFPSFCPCCGALPANSRIDGKSTASIGIGGNRSLHRTAKWSYNVCTECKKHVRSRQQLDKIHELDAILTIMAAAVSLVLLGDLFLTVAFVLVGIFIYFLASWVKNPDKFRTSACVTSGIPISVTAGKPTGAYTKGKNGKLLGRTLPDKYSFVRTDYGQEFLRLNK
jgi:hypothetical protein